MTWHRRILPAGTLLSVAVVALFGVTRPLHAQAVLTRGPYLQLGGETTMTVVWRTDGATDGAVEYGKTPQLGSRSTSARGTEHVVTLTGLQADTQYSYRILDDDVELRGGLSFRTFPPTGCSGAFRLLAWGDSGDTPDPETGLPNANQLAVAQQFDALLPDVAVHTGDLIYERGEAENFDPRYFVPYRDFVSRVTVYNSLGNHDQFTDNGQPFFDAFRLPSNNPAGTERYYSFDYSNVHFVCVDTNQSFEPGSSQHDWLEADLEANTAFWTVVYHHHTPYTAGRTHANDLINEDIRVHLGFLYDLFEVDLVLVGHTHAYERTHPIRDVTVVSAGQNPDYVDPDGTIYVTTGGGGRHLNSRLEDHPNNDFQVLYAEEFHATIIDFEGASLTGRAVSTAGDAIDTFTISKAVDPTSLPPASDCNSNGFIDACDLSEGVSLDCNDNDVPDECELEADCNGNGVPDSCDVASGQSPDCNNNDVPDFCDVASQGSADLNGDGVPDECEADCDNDGVPDSFELANGSDDCNENSLPDECDVVGSSEDQNGNGVPDECEGADCNNNGVPDSFELQVGVPDCNQNGVLDVCDVTASGVDVNGNGVPDECEADCDNDGVPDSVELANGGIDCNQNGVLDLCDVTTPGADVNANGVPDECEPDCDDDGLPDSFELANGGSDCNSNEVLDECDIARSSLDANRNGVPDECEPDCDGDGMLDSVQLAQGAPDCNSNGVLDECDLAAASRDLDGNGVPDECDPDCDKNGQPDGAQIAGGAADCNQNDILDTCDIAGSSRDLNQDGVPDECESDCDEDGTPDSFEIAEGASDCNANGILDECDVSAPGADGDADGILDECQGPVAVTLASLPDNIVFDAGMRALAFSGSLAGPAGAVWRGATFENVENGSLTDLVQEAELFRDTNGNGLLDAADESIATAPASFAEGRIEFSQLDIDLPGGSDLAFLLALDLIPADSSQLRLPALPVLPSPWTWLGALAGLFVLFALRLSVLRLSVLRLSVWPLSVWPLSGPRRYGKWVVQNAGLAVLCLALAFGCSSGGSGGGGGAAAPSTSRTLQLRLIELDVEATDGASPAPGLPVTAWSFDA